MTRARAIQGQIRSIPYLRHATSSNFKNYYETVDAQLFQNNIIPMTPVTTATRVVRPKPVYDKENVNPNLGNLG